MFGWEKHRLRGLFERDKPVLIKMKQKGFTLVEVMVTVTIMSVGILGLLQTLLLTTRLNTFSKEKTIAMEAAREKLEELRVYKFQEIYRAFNSDPSDDPDGPGTGPGPNFEVQGLNVRSDDPDGVTGRIAFPERETTVDPELGMPRDLNGDGLITDDDISLDYIFLPVSIYVEWARDQGPREIRIQTLLAERGIPRS